MRPPRIAAALAAAGVLAPSALACRRPEARRADCLMLDGPREPVGFGAAFTVTARLTCAAPPGGRIVWRQAGGVPLVEMTTARDGLELHARMPPLAAARPGPLPWGVVPLSPATRGEIALVAEWADSAGAKLARTVRIAAAPRARGLPNTPVGARVYLGGAGWQVAARPPGSSAALDFAGGAASLLPDVAGEWRLADGGGRTLALRAARYDETPLDCGRAGCHPAITDAAAASPMTNVLARLMDAARGGPLTLTLSPQAGRGDQRKARRGEQTLVESADQRSAGRGDQSPADYPACALACHATGEPGARDGGFVHVASELGAAGDLGGRRWDELPRDLHRMGGVGCLACHGPAAIPANAARWSVLRADVCAVCHDAPPRYGHVAAWRATAMARADRDPRARREPACARCHTTWGFLAAVATPERAPVDRRPPDDVGAVGIGCAACHAVHDAKSPGAAHLLRATPVPALLAGTTQANVCLSCHAPDAAGARPEASAAALWLGRGGLDPATAQPITGAAPHAAIAGGCVGCHRAGPDDVERGAGHGFRVPDSACAPCHPRVPPSGTLREKAKIMLSSLGRRDSQAPPHASSAEGPRADRRTPRGRAIWDILLVAEDPAAEVHNPRYARALLDAAAAVIAGKTR